MMKKVVSASAIIIGALLLLVVAAPMMIGAVAKVPAHGSVSIIGGADGPTAILLAGTIGIGGVILGIGIGVLLVLAGIWGLKKNKKQN